jgi:single-strand DNA-binding protein
VQASTIEITGNLVRDPELRRTESGISVCNIVVAVTPRERQGEGWKDGETQYWTVSAWRKLGENVAKSLERGDPVTVTGRVNFRSWETKEGEKRVQHLINADSVSVPLGFHTVIATKAERGTSPGEQGESAEDMTPVPRLRLANGETASGIPG